MAGRTFQPILGTLDQQVVLLPISWAPNGANPVVQSTIRGRGVESVTRTGVGIFDVKLQDQYARVLSMHATLQLAVADDKLAANVGPETINATTRTVTVRIFDISAPGAADVAPDPQNRINLLLVLGNSSP